MEKENKRLEFKRDMTKTYLKTVSAFANYFDGDIIFGRDDSGNIKEIKDLKQLALNLENQINDSIKPKPDYIITMNKDKTITLHVKKGFFCPYLYNGKAYKRNDTSTIEVDDVELRRLYREGLNISFDEITLSTETNLSFKILENELEKALNLNVFNDDILKSLNLLSGDKHNNAASLLSDKNDFPGIDIVIFGENQDQFKKRITLEHMSLIKQFYESIKLFEETYTYEEVTKENRIQKEIIPLKAFKEVIANAIVHRIYDVNINTKVCFFKDRLEVTSPGGLPYGISKEDYLRGSFSLLRNPVVGNVFYRLKIIEAFATGIKRINECYCDSNSKPTFEIGETYISIILPSYEETVLTVCEKKILDIMNDNIAYSRIDLENLTNFSKDKIIRILNSLIEKKLIVKQGDNRSTIYLKN